MTYNVKDLKELVRQLITETEDAGVSWEEVSAFREYRMYSEECSVVLLKESLSQISLIVYGKEGELLSRFQSDLDRNGKDIVRIFDVVSSLRKETVKPHSISFFKFTQQLILQKTKMEDYRFIDNPVIKVSKKNDPFVEPLFSQQPTSMGFTPIESAQVILISAPGATGKSALCHYVSSNKNIPIIDLSEHVAMGAYSVLGLLSDHLPFEDFYTFQKGLLEGTNCLIVDAIDEGYARTGQVAFEGFLDDISKMAIRSSGTPFIILGRTSSLEFTSLYLEEKQVRVSMLQIEPFTMDKAKDFIDMYLKTSATERYRADYQAVQEYIINEIGGFFKDENELNKKQYERFIGYAPVLLSIATLLKNNQNYNSLLNELQSGRKKHVELIVTIVEMLLSRDQKKIQDQLKVLIDEYPQEFRDDVLSRAYSVEEQCERIFCALSGSQPTCVRSISADPQFNSKYEESCSKWFEEHPFMLSKNKIQNKVFESYVLARLTKKKEFIPQIIDYIERFRGNSYLFFDLFASLYEQDDEVRIDHRLVPALIDSFKMMDRPTSKGIVDIIGSEKEKGKVDCSISFSKDDDEREERLFKFFVPEGTQVVLPAFVSHLYIDAPIGFVVPSSSFEIGAPTNIVCSSFEIKSQSLLLTSSGNNRVCFSVDDFIVSYTESVPVISSPGNVQCDIFTDSALSYPYIQYRKQSVGQIEDQELRERYQKMRRIFLQFRSHKKGNLGRLQEMIDNLIGRTSAIGGMVLKAMKDSGMIYEEGKMYIINNNKVNEVLGLTYDDILMCQMNDRVKSFLSSIKS